MSEKQFDEVEKPKHYNLHPSGIECVEINENFSGNLAAAIKYVWRDGLKDPVPLKDLKKARWYLRREIERTRTTLFARFEVCTDIAGLVAKMRTVIDADAGLLGQVLTALLSPSGHAALRRALYLVENSIAQAEAG